MVGCITDEMVETYAVAGTPDEVRDKLARFEGLVDEVYLGPPWASPDLVRTSETFDAIIDTFAPR
jgi:alkanesulfonate monooxygenase SsuD/methylene tetrahydromethanopterin reductase-like flavin-dependent oxidoreductase (luciferase family)